MLKPTSIRWDEKGIPYSVEFHDQYFCTENGYEEALFFAIQGNDLAQRFRDLDPARNGTFVLMETGFGTGLNFCTVWELWDQLAPKNWQLHFISVELYPLSKEDVDRALRLWPRLALYREALHKVYAWEPGIKTFSFPGVQLTIVFADVVQALRQIHDHQLGIADAWFLHGFSPANNPAMWTEDVFQAMRNLSKSGTTLATFTVAGQVRRGLQANGFHLQKIPGRGQKRQMLKGHFLPEYSFPHLFQ